MDDFQTTTQADVATYKPRIGDRGTFYPSAGTDEQAEAAEVVHVWGDSCVNVKLDSGAERGSVLVLMKGQEASGYYFKPTLTVQVDIGVMNANAGEPLPLPVPPSGASWREQFDYAVAMQRHEDMVAQTAAINAQVAASIDGARAIREATAVAHASPTDRDRWWDVFNAMVRTSGDLTRMIETKSVGFFTDAATAAVVASRTLPT